MSVSYCISLYVSIFIFFKVRGNGDNDIMYTYYQYCLTSIVRSTVLGFIICYPSERYMLEHFLPAFFGVAERTVGRFGVDAELPTGNP